MPQVLEIDTSKSLYAPLEVHINGETFKVRNLTVDALERIQALQGDATAGSVAAIKKMLSEVLEGPLELLGHLTVEQVAEVVGFAVTRNIKPSADEKNAPGPGQEK